MSEEWAARARSFGQVAELYDRSRPGYPDQLYTDVLALRVGRRVLEVGAGTGRATVELARRGATVRALEPDPAMAALAVERTRGLLVQVEQTTLEEHRADPGSADLVVSAQAWHWVDRDAGSANALRALAPDGLLALWWNRPRDPDGGDAVWDAVHAAYDRFAPEISRRNELSTRPEREATADPSAGFGPWTRRTYDWTQVYDAESYGNLISTHSNHLRLPADRRERLLAGVREAILDHGDRIEYHYRTLLIWAGPASS